MPGAERSVMLHKRLQPGPSVPYQTHHHELVFPERDLFGAVQVFHIEIWEANCHSASLMNRNTSFGRLRRLEIITATGGPEGRGWRTGAGCVAPRVVPCFCYTPRHEWREERERAEPVFPGFPGHRSAEVGDELAGQEPLQAPRGMDAASQRTSLLRPEDRGTLVRSPGRKATRQTGRR